MSTGPKLPALRIVRGYWTAQPRIDGRKVTWTFGAAATVSRATAEEALRQRLTSPQVPYDSSRLTVERLAELFLEHAVRVYVRPTGELTGESNNLYFALQPFVKLFGKMRAAEIRPRHFKHYAEQQIKAEVARSTLNQRIGAIKRWVKWAGDEELVPPDTVLACSVVQRLKRGRTEARETKRIPAVPMAQVEQTLAFLPPTLQTMVRLQISTVMRPEEVCALRLCDLDVSSTPWVYVPEWHKNTHRGQERRIFIGEQGQTLLAPYMANRTIHAPLFSPARAVGERRGKQPRARVTDCYDTRSYRRAIEYACDRAFPLPAEYTRQQVPAGGRKKSRLETMVEWRARLGDKWEVARRWKKDHRWAPNRLRKLGLDLVSRACGEQAAKAYAGHTRVETTREHYLTQDDELAREVAIKMG